MRYIGVLFLASAAACVAQTADLAPCQARLQNDVLLLDTGTVFQTFRWNHGNLVRLAFGDSGSRQSIVAPDEQSTVALGKTTSATVGEGNLSVAEQPATAIRPAHIAVEVTCAIASLEIKRVYRLFPRCPAIPCELYLKGDGELAAGARANAADLDQIENDAARRQGETGGWVLERLRLAGNHWKARAVEFFDVTDRNNTLVQSCDRLLYAQEAQLRGNLLCGENLITGDRFFLLKEAPTSSIQLHYPGADFTVKRGEVKVIGCGVAASDLNRTSWTRAYGSVLGLASSRDELGLLSALRRYQRTVRVHQPGRDEMIMMNTWGDRSRDTKLNEAFCLAEIEAGARLGITHFQLDDGWQTGRSKNSAFQGGSSENIWRRPDYWKPDPARFPRGLAPIIAKGRELGVEVCLWFSPSGDNDNVNWEKDADMLIGLYREYGIRTFKIDGYKVPNKTTETHFRSMLDKVVQATSGAVVFDLDVTAMRRGGYNFFNEYGNIFVENRYTDHGSYYPFRTLRNLWMLSRYLPPENLQFEFLNLWRNPDKYVGDPLAPASYGFDYAFATTMMAQPLAWFEATGLPAAAFDAAPLIKRYRALQTQLHAGVILPIGDEPDGRCWTGFQSIDSDDEGYLLVFRELTPAANTTLATWLRPGTKVTCEPVLGSGRAFTAEVDARGGLPVALAAPNSFSLFRYRAVK